MSEKKTQKVYTEEFKRQAVELTIHSGRSIVQIGRELGVSEASLYLWRKRYGVRASNVAVRVYAPAPATQHLSSRARVVMLRLTASGLAYARLPLLSPRLPAVMISGVQPAENWFSVRSR